MSLVPSYFPTYRPTHLPTFLPTFLPTYLQTEALARGIKYLMAQQKLDGDWEQEGITGVFNRNCGITYSQYRNIFPLWALGRYAREVEQQ